jgi:FixJ family two-component response regulator
VGRILLVDDDVELGAVMCELFRDAGAEDCLVAHSLHELEQQRDRALGCDLAIVDVNLGHDQPSGLDVHRWLRDSGYQHRIVFLTGHAQSHPLVMAAARTPGTEVLAKPIPAATLLRVAGFAP